MGIPHVTHLTKAEMDKRIDVELAGTGLQVGRAPGGRDGWRAELGRQCGGLLEARLWLGPSPGCLHFCLLTGLLQHVMAGWQAPKPTCLPCR